MASPSDYFDTQAEKRMADAVAKGDLTTARALLSSGEVAPDTVGRDELGLLQIAIEADQRAVFDLLIETGAVGNPKAAATGHAMYQATVDSNDYYLTRLHQAGASLDNFGAGELLLLSAGRSQIPGRMDYYIRNGADLDAKTNFGGTAALSLATTTDYRDVLTLLDAGASPWAATPNGQTIGFWLERAKTKPAWKPRPETIAARDKIIEKLRAAGVPHPPPPPIEVKRRLEEGSWGPN